MTQIFAAIYSLKLCGDNLDALKFEKYFNVLDVLLE
jgi:hypothetical protein